MNFCKVTINDPQGNYLGAIMHDVSSGILLTSTGWPLALIFNKSSLNYEVTYNRKLHSGVKHTWH